MFRRVLSRRTLAAATVATAATAGGGYYFLNSGPSYPPSTKETRRPPPPWTPPSREEMLQALRASGTGDEFDLLIIGGGATGSGVAVDAATRGLKVALVERDDFSAGESPVSYTRSLPHLFLQARRLNQLNLSTGESVICRRPFSSLIMNSISSYGKPCMNAGSSCRRRHISQLCSP